jgi:hypothetical protein
MPTPLIRAATEGRGRRPVGARAVLALTSIGTLITAACFYPGYLDGDSNWQYRQGVSGEYVDMHPVVMSWLLGRLDQIIEGAGGFFLLMSIGFWASLGLTLRAFTSSLRGFVIAAVVIGTSIPVFSMVGQIQKDLGMVVGLLGAFGLLVEADRRRSLPALLAALPLLWYALAVRHDGVTAVLPFALWVGWLLARDQFPPLLARHFAAPWRRLAVGVLVLATLFSVSLLATRAILGERGRHVYFPQFLMAYDMVGISVRSGQNVMSEVYYPQQPFSMQELRAMYDAKTAFYLFWGRPWLRKVPRTSESHIIEKIQGDWLRAILAEPGAYLAHRTTLFLAGLGIGAGPPGQHQHIGPPRGRTFEYRGPTVFEWPHARALVAFFDSSRSTLLFRPWPYLVIGAIGVAMSWLRPNRHRFEITLLATSSATYIAPLLIIGVASEFRYMWWPILTAMLQLVLALDGRRAEATREHVA